MGEIQVKEFLGDCNLFYLDVGGLPYVARLKENISKSPGDSLEIYPDMRQAHFFDATTGERIHLGEWE